MLYGDWRLVTGALRLETTIRLLIISEKPVKMSPRLSSGAHDEFPTALEYSGTNEDYSQLASVAQSVLQTPVSSAAAK